jgi:hypothetical protein
MLAQAARRFHRPLRPSSPAWNIGKGKFSLSFMRHNGKWVVLYERLSLDECLAAIEDDPWFQ